MPVKHLKVSLKSNSADSTKIQPTDWNDSHVIDIYVDNEVPSGSINGSNAIFLLSNIPSPASSLQVFLNGVLKANGVGYSLNGQVIQMTEIPFAGDDLRCWYRKV